MQNKKLTPEEIRRLVDLILLLGEIDKKDKKKKKELQKRVICLLKRIIQSRNAER